MNHSNIKVFPSFPETAFFSGEEFTCILTFKNVSEPSPSSSTTSLAPFEGLSRIVNSKFAGAGAEWMAESGRSASEGVPGQRPSSHERHTSVPGSEEENSRSTSSQRDRGRSQSVVISPTTPTAVKFEERNSIDEKRDGTRNGISSLTINTNINPSIVHASPLEIDPASPSPSPLPHISKLDLHSTAEDDASSEASSIGPSKPQQSSQTNIFNAFSPRSSLDIRGPDRELLPSTRRQSRTRPLPRSPLSRGSTDLGTRAETLIMGYAQIDGNFMIDEALIHASEFDEVKSKGVMGGKSGGGVVGVDARWSASWTGLGPLGSFGFGSLFGGTQPSSLAEMRDRATSKTIPILLTPPSILFVDIRLLPGESRSFSYTFKIPRNLPPSHRGRALRISYSLVITTQRPGRSGQHLSTAEIPFRLFSNIDEHGRQPKYDLKSPIILLRDEAKTSSIKEGDAPPLLSTTIPKQIRRSSTYSDKPIESSQEEFMVFVDRLLESLGKIPLSATDTSFRLDVPRTPSPNPTARERTFRRFSCRETIDIIVQRGLRAMPAKLGVFEIGKNGVTVATLTLPRTTFKLGETIEGVIDLEDGRIKCYQVKSSLESAEDIDPAVSVRSLSSIYRATRRIHISKSEFTTFARRVQFAFEIPNSMAPSFETSSVRHHWSLRLEFMTSLIPESELDDSQQPPEPPPNLFNLVDKDDRASTYVAADTLYCESFDCHVPVQVLPTNYEIPEDRVGSAGFVV